MNRTLATVALAAAAVAAPFLAGCAAPASSGTVRVASNELPYRPGQGVVIAATQAREPISAAAGGTSRAVSSAAAGSAPATYRLTVRMNDGTLQYVDTDSREITVGSRVELTADRTIRKL
ncbi:MAG TPA: hypothetical protein VF211_12080 [Burkholderiales bacterium]